MNILFYTAGLFFIAFFIHLLYWRFHLPRNQTRTLIVIFLCILAIGLFVFRRFLGKIDILGISAPANIYEYLYLVFLFLCLTAAYIITYSAIEADSPSLAIVMRIAKTGSKGLKHETLLLNMTDDFLVKPRLEDLVESKMTCLDRGKYKITCRGALFINIFIFYRNLLKKNRGG